MSDAAAERIPLIVTESGDAGICPSCGTIYDLHGVDQTDLAPPVGEGCATCAATEEELEQAINERSAESEMATTKESARAEGPPPVSGAEGPPEPAPEEQERAAAEARTPEPAPEPEVRPEEMTEGVGRIIAKPRLANEIVAALGEPLDPNRVRRRAGRGGGKFEYLAGHDVKRQLNRIFGFGGWKTKRISNVLIEAVEVKGKGDTTGWHVGYQATAEVSVLLDDGTWVSYQDDGYGDGVEYGPAARVTACELAIKEAVTDAIKRAATCLGDQFGLILYAKDDEVKRIGREQNAAASRGVAVSIPEVLERLTLYVEDGRPWVKEAVEGFYSEVDAMPAKWSELPSGVQINALARLSRVVDGLDQVREAGWKPGEDVEDDQKRVREAFRREFEGVVIQGPDPFEPRIPF